MLLVGVHEHLGVATGREPVPLRLQLLAQLVVVEDLPVLHDDDRPVLVADRLVAVLEVDDRQAPRRQCDGPFDVLPGVVGPAVAQGQAHLLQTGRIHLAPIERHQATDAAHG